MINIFGRGQHFCTCKASGEEKCFMYLNWVMMNVVLYFD